MNEENEQKADGQKDPEETVEKKDDDTVELDLDDEGDDEPDDEPANKKPAQETKAQKVARLERQLKRAKKGLKGDDEGEGAPSPSKDSKSGDLDYGQKAFLRAEGIKGTAELELVKEYAATGKDLETILENRHFQNDLKDLREGQASADALPKGKNRGSGTAKDQVDYYLKNGGLPPPEQVELRRKVVNARAGTAKSGSNFTSTPVVK